MRTKPSISNTPNFAVSFLQNSVFTAVIWLVFYFFRIVPISNKLDIWGVLLIWLCFFPSFNWINSKNRSIPLLEMLCIAYFLAYCLPIYMLDNVIIIQSQPVRYNSELQLKAVIYTCISVSSLQISYYILKIINPIKFRLVFPNISFSTQIEQQKVATLLAITTIFRVSQYLGYLNNSSIFSTISFINNILFNSLLFLSARIIFSSKALRFFPIIFYLCLIGASIFSLVTTSIETLMIPFVLVFFANWNEKKKLPVSWLVLSFTIFSLLNPLKAQMREALWYNEQKINSIQAINLWFDQATDYTTKFSRDTTNTLLENFQANIARINLLHRFEHVLYMTPKYIDHYRGDTYNYFFYSWVPRAFWQNKPSTASLLNKIDLDYSLDSNTGSTTIGIGQLAESYANFGIQGNIFIYLGFGCFFYLLISTMCHHLIGEAILIAWGINLLNGIGSATVVQFGNIFQLILVSWVIFHLVFSRKQTNYFAKRSSSYLS